MSNLLPPNAQKNMKAEYRARFLLAGSLALLITALIYMLALIPAAAATTLFSTAPSQTTTETAPDVAADSAALAHTKALLSALQPLSATTSLDAVLAALSQRGVGIHVESISYSPTQQTITLAGVSDAPSDVNTYREALQSDLRFQNVSVPVSALLGSQNGSFTITMKIAP